ncbi:response regulator transcription factor [Pseudomonas sp. CCI1.2]|uniref:response regulator transcription factor n=1 Tax=Pseudomonas sp. CCI1.2 TaxID=3048614 RepID=UPI002B23E427|nr:response regulator transcription factor [Pseudomonas sp. CCI1.2]MEB0120230.1 response regulator transcription factor [Pseudomonas sp. CCI1.2]
MNAATAKPLRVILADDHPIFLIGLRVVLEQHSNATVIAEAGSPSALAEALKNHPCDVLVTDFMMPVDVQNDGLRLLERVRRDYPQLPIVVVTMLNNAGLFRSILALGVTALLSKASLAGELPAAIECLHQGKQYIADSVARKLLEAGDYGSETLIAHEHLSPKESEVLRLLGAGRSVGEIAAQLSRSNKTVSAQKVSAMGKLGLSNDAGLFIYLQEHGLT